MDINITFFKNDEAPFFTVEIRAAKSRDGNDPTPNMFYRSPEGDEYVSLGPDPQDDSPFQRGTSMISRSFWNLEEADEWVNRLINQAKSAIEIWREIEVPEEQTITL